MRRWVVSILVLGVGLSAAVLPHAIATTENGVCLRATSGCGARVEFTFGAGFTPHALPEEKLVPIGLSFSGEVSMSDGSKPPALREVTIAFDRHGQFEAGDLPVCPKRQLATLRTDGARRMCHDSMLGTGTVRVEDDASRSSLPLTLFNGGVHDGVTRIFIHVSTSGSTSLVIPLSLSTVNNRHYGWEGTARIPPIEDDASVVGFDLTIKRLVGRKGEKRGYALARCPSGLLQARMTATFIDGTKLQAIVARACTPAG